MATIIGVIIIIIIEAITTAALRVVEIVSEVRLVAVSKRLTTAITAKKTAASKVNIAFSQNLFSILQVFDSYFKNLLMVARVEASFITTVITRIG